MNHQKNTTERKVEETILQTPKVIKVGGREYEVRPPTLGTLYMVSSIVSEIPEIPESKDTATVVGSAVCARDIARVIAVLVAGSKADRGHRKGSLLRRVFRRSRIDELTDEIMEECTPREALGILVEILGNSQLADFFALTTFLRGASLTRPTKVVKETTAPGR